MLVSKIGLLVLSQSVGWGRSVSVPFRAAPPSPEAAFPGAPAFGASAFGAAPFGAFGKPSSALPGGVPGGLPVIDINPCDPKAFAAKEYDVVIIGFGGRMADGVERALEAVRSSEKVKVAWVTRKNLEALKYQWALEMGPAAIKHPTVFEIDIVQQPEKILELANKSRVVLNLAGPYEANKADSLVRAAVSGCAHYVDVSTETKWQRRVYDEFHLKAVARHLTIVQAAGFDSVVSDLLAASAASDLVKSGHKAPTHVMVIWELVNTMRYIAKEQVEQAAFTHHGPVMDPYILAPEVPLDLRVDTIASGYLPANIIKPLLHGSVQHYARASSDCPIIRRSMHSQYHDSAISVQEVCTTSLLPSLAAFRKNRSNPALAGQPPAGVFPLPGQPAPAATEGPSPSPEELAAGSFMGSAIAVHQPNATEGGTKSVPWTRVMLEGLGDAHYVGSPKIVLQVVLGLVFDGPQQFGYVTPTMALGVDKLEERLLSVDDGGLVRMRHGLQ